MIIAMTAKTNAPVSASSNKARAESAKPRVLNSA